MKLFTQVLWTNVREYCIAHKHIVSQADIAHRCAQCIHSYQLFMVTILFALSGAVAIGEG